MPNVAFGNESSGDKATRGGPSITAREVPLEKAKGGSLIGRSVKKRRK